ncbi:CYCLIC NUCLEOTIDE GATED CHANNEL 2, DEFENSE NO DEATH 1, CYCLIC NUCLEOTIDE-GATED CHANNEL 2 [Hibiscus trionum]|uniref:CYCLIC NUCLEOTIDE GATED CHANNEL 2, DEFENSE NO DEATH 1, CYCLIC NUCLEOTIDE-GATED CHANNEL 2 n=1 Tax=Hibiscus trionum TaxID=183268 RepID=A0A9W7ISG8_HIBTR|nr:CYCLIC NUCLEOTIDE GATED CHANNEL 2, DEFENSE NO DEATH 1, CYCLIC NUCLEOTIDE-GATED CHANNEL 2 [Hibiscus trionum]
MHYPPPRHRPFSPFSFHQKPPVRRLFRRETITPPAANQWSHPISQKMDVHNELRLLKNERDGPVSSSIECYACTQVGLPVFHSTTCDSLHQPQWEAFAGSSLFPVDSSSNSTRPRSMSTSGPFGKILDPRSLLVQRWNRVLLVARGIALAVDPMFFYTMTLMVTEGGPPCVYLDGGLAAIVTVVRTCVDVVHLWHLWLQFRLAYVSKESLVIGCGKLVWDARAIASHYVRSFKGFWFDCFVILPVPQAVFWLIVPKLLRKEQYKLIMTILLAIFLFQFLPKVYHSLCLMRRMRKVTGYIFGSIWWGFGLNLIAYLIASHVAGGCWYVLATQRVVTCLQQQCERSARCDISSSCSNRVCSQYPSPASLLMSQCGGGNSTLMTKSFCFDPDGPFRYGIYEPALPVISSNSLAVKILYPIFWGLLNLSSFGNELSPTSSPLEVVFSICIVLGGLLLFTLLIGNIQVFLHVVMANRKKLQLRRRDVEWWMRRRQLPYGLRQRVRHFESQTWVIMGGEAEMKWIEELPDGLRRDIKRYLCLDLIKKVPLFHSFDDLILDNICDRVKSLIYSKDEKIIREGDPVLRMVFIVTGRVTRSQGLSKGKLATSVLEPGGFLGDELFSWCLRRPFVDRLPASSATFICSEYTEAFGLNADDLRYITEHFRYRFANNRLKRTARYYSSNWRTWAAVNIQLAWRCYRMKIESEPLIPMIVNDGIESRLRKYAAIFLSIRPHDHLQ